MVTLQGTVVAMHFVQKHVRTVTLYRNGVGFLGTVLVPGEARRRPGGIYPGAHRRAVGQDQRGSEDLIVRNQSGRWKDFHV